MTIIELPTLNAFLTDKSYIVGFEPSQADAVVFGAVAKPDAAVPHALRWYTHIATFDLAQ